MISTSKILSFLLLLAALGPAPAVVDLKESPSWYYAGGQWNGVNILITCEAKTTIFRTIGFDLGTPVTESPKPEAEVAEACRTRDRLLDEGFFLVTKLRSVSPSKSSSNGWERTKRVMRSPGYSSQTKPRPYSVTDGVW